MAKRVTNPRTRRTAKGKHEQVNYLAINGDAPAPDEASARFTIYLRQSLKDSEDFSCGIAWNAPDGTVLTLARYNGSSHRHDPAVYQCHIHRATERAIRENKKAEHYVEISNSYSTLDGALSCLVKDFNVSGFSTKPDKPVEPDLFSPP